MTKKITQFLRAFRDPNDPTDAGSDAGSPIRFIAATEGLKRDGLDLVMEGGSFDRYSNNPVFLWAHDYSSLPLGRAATEVDENNNLAIEVTFDQEDEFARQVEGKYRRGFLNAVSAGFDVLELEGNRATSWELLDVSAVSVPLDPEALMERYRSAQRQEVHTSRALPPHTVELAPEYSLWSPLKVMEELTTPNQLRTAHAWVNEDADPASRSAYKFLHHDAKGKVVWRGVATAMVALFQPWRFEIPEADRLGVYKHLARHYRQFNREAPEFTSVELLTAVEPDLIQGLFLEGELDLVPQDMANFRVGAMLSKRNSDDLNKAIELIQGVLDRATKEEPNGSEEPRSLLKDISGAGRTNSDVRLRLESIFNNKEQS